MTPDLRTVSHTSDAHGRIDLNVAVAGLPDDPLVMCVHGWPESWHSWSNQMEHLTDRGYRVAAMDVRGYGGSSRPQPVEAYRLLELCGDVAAVVETLSPDRPAILIGHDWGSPTVYNTARAFPHLVRAVAGMSVPYLPASPGDPMELWNALYTDRFFYMKYFQEPGVAEAAFESDLPAALRKVYFAASADAPSDLWFTEQPDGAAMLDFLVDPDPAPPWMQPERFAPVIEANTGRSTHGWFNRYRAQYLDGDDLSAVGPPNVQQPACFIGGAEDIVRKFVPGLDLFDVADAALDDTRGVTLIDGAGHWVHQEKPAQANAALDEFLDGL
jgi:pimeloyl-ACP methyl ester carboxylesterase